MNGDKDILGEDDVTDTTPVDPVAEALERVMQTEDGRTVLRDIICGTGFFVNTFATDPHANAHNCGMRSVGVHLWNDMELASLENRVKMMQEGVSE